MKNSFILVSIIFLVGFVFAQDTRDMYINELCWKYYFD
jgi:hypothetical protein